MGYVIEKHTNITCHCVIHVCKIRLMTSEMSFIDKMQGVNGPEFFFDEVLGVETLQDFQREKILRSIALYDRVSIAATHSVGKTWSMARIALWFTAAYKNSKVITTAPTGRQIKKLLWGEMRTAHAESKHPLGGKMLTTEWQIGPEWYAMGFSPQKEAASDSKEQSGSAFQGFHADYILVIFDEATGIPADIWKMAEGLLTSGIIVKFVAIANPTTKASEFYKTFSDDSWFNVYLSCFDSPNLIANGITNLHKLKRELSRLKEMDKDERLLMIANYEKPVPHLLSCRWVMAKALKWGIDHPLFQSKALGQFPDVDEDVLVQLADVEAAMRRDLKHDYAEIRCIGVDVARFGDDDTSITTLVGAKQTGRKTLSQRSTTVVSGHVIQLVEFEKINYPKTRILVDATGVGAGVYDNLHDHYRRDNHVEVIEVHFGQSPVMDTDDNKHKNEQGNTDADEINARYVNLKARGFDILADDIKKELHLLDEAVYPEELPTIQFSYNSKGKMEIESKKDYKKRTGNSSPDDSDSLMLANLGRHRKLTRGIFTPITQQRTLNKPDKTRDTISRIADRIKVNNY